MFKTSGSGKTWYMLESLTKYGKVVSVVVSWGRFTSTRKVLLGRSMSSGFNKAVVTVFDFVSILLNLLYSVFELQWVNGLSHNYGLP